MLIYNILFYVFSFFLVSSALGVIFSKSPVYSVFFLIFAFFNTAALFVLLGSEFLAMTLMIVYVGAIAILFLFIVMMLNVSWSKIYEDKIKGSTFFLMLGIFLFLEISLLIYYSLFYENKLISDSGMPFLVNCIKSNAEQIGLVMYTEYGYVFQLCGLILFATIVSVIFVTNIKKTFLSKRQNVEHQLSRNKKKSVKLVKIKSGKGIDV